MILSQLFRTVSKIIKNKNPNAKTQMELMLNDSHGVKEFGLFYKKNAEYIEMVMANILLRFAQEEEYSSENSAFYRKGIADFVDVFIECYKEVYNNVKKSVNDSQREDEDRLFIEAP